MESKKMTRHFYSPISTTPCAAGWKAVFEVLGDAGEMAGISAETVVVWAVMEHRIDVLDENEIEVLSTVREENFICGLVVDSDTEGGLRPALTSEGLIGYQAPGEPLEDFAEKIGYNPAAFLDHEDPKLNGGLH